MNIKEPTTVKDLLVLIGYLTFIVFAGYVAGYVLVWALFTIWRALL